MDIYVIASDFSTKQAACHVHGTFDRSAPSSNGGGAASQAAWCVSATQVKVRREAPSACLRSRFTGLRKTRFGRQAAEVAQ